MCDSDIPPANAAERSCCKPSTGADEADDDPDGIPLGMFLNDWFEPVPKEIVRWIDRNDVSNLTNAFLYAAISAFWG